MHGGERRYGTVHTMCSLKVLRWAFYHATSLAVEDVCRHKNSAHSMVLDVLRCVLCMCAVRVRGIRVSSDT